jgi:hypothetical protein
LWLHVAPRRAEFVTRPTQKETTKTRHDARMMTTTMMTEDIDGKEVL